MSEILNVHYLETVEERDGGIVVVRHPIARSEELLNKILALKECASASVLDVQKVFCEALTEKERHVGYGYTYPSHYMDRYVSTCTAPAFISDAHYNEWLKEIREDACHEYDMRLQECARNGSQPILGSRLEYVEKRVNKNIDDRKREYCSVVERFITAKNYYEAKTALQKDPSVKICSTDRIGWPDSFKRSQDFQVTQDIRVSVFTNFAYGNSAYFYIGVTYKGVDILPYSFLVKYYYVKSLDIARYTRNYHVERESWHRALSFVETIANLAQKNPEEFVSEWVKGEVDKMVLGLEAIVKSPNEKLEGLLKRFKTFDSDNKDQYVSIANIDNARHGTFNDRMLYAACPNEFSVMWKVEKITGALDTLEKIKALASIYPEAIDRADRVRKMSMGLVPEIGVFVGNVERDIGVLQTEVDGLALKIGELNKAIAPHDKVLAEEKKRIEDKYTIPGRGCTLSSFQLSREYRVVQVEYERAHPEYVGLCAQRRDFLNKKSIAEENILMRKTFVDRVLECKSRILSEKADAA